MIALWILAAVAYAAVGSYVGGRVAVYGYGKRSMMNGADIGWGVTLGAIWPVSLVLGIIPFAWQGLACLIRKPLRLLLWPLGRIADAGVRHQLREHEKKELPEARALICRCGKCAECRPPPEKKYCKVPYCLKEIGHDGNHSVRP